MINDHRTSSLSPYFIFNKIKSSLSYLNPVSWIPSASESKAQLDAFLINNNHIIIITISIHLHLIILVILGLRN
jgi:hypothetical protein